MTVRSHPSAHLTRGRPHWRLVVPALLVVLSVGPGCSIEEVQDIPRCDGGSMPILAAQSVPTAEQVPCFGALPTGWEAAWVRIDQEGTRIRFDSDRAGASAAVFHYAEECDHTDAVVAPSEYDDVERYDFIELVSPRFRAQRYYVFTGGCIWWEFDFDPDATAALSIELGDRLGMVTRDDLNASIRATFIDEEV